MLRIHRIPFSTNVERVALAAGHKGLEVDWLRVPFIRYAIAEPDPADTDPFHAVLRELEAPPSMRAWVERVHARPRA